MKQKRVSIVCKLDMKIDTYYEFLCLKKKNHVKMKEFSILHCERGVKCVFVGYKVNGKYIDILHFIFELEKII